MAAILTCIFGLFSLISQLQGRPNQLYERFILDALFPQAYNSRIDTLQSRDNNEPVFDKSWSAIDRKIGQVGGVAVDSENQPYVFHRGSRVWDQNSFNWDNTFAQRSPIKENTILKIDKDNGRVLKEFGAGRFYMPHGLTVDNGGNIWVTDVGSHQVMKIKKEDGTPLMTLGEKLVPGNDNKHFCKPTDVAVASNGDFFVSDGIQCFRAGLNNSSDTGSFVHSFHDQRFGEQIFAVAYGKDPQFGDVLYAVNGDHGQTVPRGFTLSLDTGRILNEWGPIGSDVPDFGQPHDVAVSPDGANIYVGDIVKGHLPLTRFNRST
ncbi:hypothetical protein KUTeg_022618 [Tegillarca granosa]|uniref:peptidylamidoglycolate lyase n=1 Tax=Tegillarca granosa TaxID=220873 RepID=A0ABQ9E340_TEGGR|nr:hypothetical protein KUTeg_022618 [Tegillarca granosa]